MRITDYERVNSVQDSDVLLIDGNRGTKSIRVNDLHLGPDVSMIAPIEVSPSTHAYNKGDQLIYDDILYTAVENIAVGDGLFVNSEKESAFLKKTWNGLRSFYGSYIWTDGENIYFSVDSDQYVLDKATSTWSKKTWNGFTPSYGSDIWTDGENIYYSDDIHQYVLDKATSTWNSKTWNGYTNLNGSDIWTDGENIYYSSDIHQYVLDKATSTWSEKTWNGLTSFGGYYIWTDGENIYYSSGTQQYILDKATSTWNSKTWNGYTNLNGSNIWTDGENIYYSDGSSQYVLDKATSTWNTKTWDLTGISGRHIWTDGENTYYSNGGSSKQYFLYINEIIHKNITPSDPIVDQMDQLTEKVGFETAQISKVVGDTSVTFTNSAIKMTSELTLLSENSSNTPIFYTAVTVSAGSATYTFPALTVATKFSLKVR